MAKDTTKITFGKEIDGQENVYFAPLGTVIDTSPFSDISAVEGIVGLGEISEDGIAVTPGHSDSDPVLNMSGSPVIYTSGEYTPSLAFSLMQAGNDFEVDQVVFGKNNVVGTKEEYSVAHNKNNKSEGMLIIDTQFDNGARERKICKHMTIQLSDDIVDNYQDVRLLPCIIKPKVDLDGNAFKSYKEEKAPTVGP